MYFESHAHYDDKRYDKDRDEVIHTLIGNNIEYVINIGANMKSSKRSIELSKKYDFFYGAVGVHPHDVEKMTQSDMDTLEEYCKLPKVVAVGEIGLDFFYDHSPRDAQRSWFKKQLALSEKVNLPVVIHSRDASQETFDIIKSSNQRKGVIHCYSGSKEMAIEYVKMGFYIGVGGVVTFSNAKSLIETVEALPLTNIVIETDCPYLAPEPHRGERNDSRMLKYIVEKIAQIKNISVDETLRITMDNGKKLFNV